MTSEVRRRPPASAPPKGAFKERDGMPYPQNLQKKFDEAAHSIENLTHLVASMQLKEDKNGSRRPSDADDEWSPESSTSSQDGRCFSAASNCCIKSLAAAVAASAVYYFFPSSQDLSGSSYLRAS
jgi:hypothetical protein